LPFQKGDSWAGLYTSFSSTRGSIYPGQTAFFAKHAQDVYMYYTQKRDGQQIGFVPLGSDTLPHRGPVKCLFHKLYLTFIQPFIKDSVSSPLSFFTSTLLQLNIVLI
jgi:hypothetical protein